MSGERKQPFLRRLWMRLLATLGVGAAILLSWWWRVEDARTPESVPLATLGQPIEMGRSRATPLALEIRREAGQPDQLVMTAILENVTSESQLAFFGDPPTPPELIIADNQIVPPEILLTRDGETLYQLQPRMPEEVQLVWTLTPEALPAGVAPEEVEIRFSKERFKLRDDLYGRSSWLDTEPAARLVATPEIRG